MSEAILLPTEIFNETWLQGWSLGGRLLPQEGPSLLQRRPNQSGSPMQRDKEVTILWKFVSICQTSPDYKTINSEHGRICPKGHTTTCNPNIRNGGRDFVLDCTYLFEAHARGSVALYSRGISWYIHEEYSGDTQSVHLSPLGVSDPSRWRSMNEGGVGDVTCSSTLIYPTLLIHTAL